MYASNFLYIFLAFREYVFDRKAMFMGHQVDEYVEDTLIRYYVLSKNKKGIIKIEVVKAEMSKDIENNYYLPNIIHDFIEENQVINLINIHRIKKDYNFLKPESIGISIKTSNSEKYFKEYFE